MLSLVWHTEGPVVGLTYDMFVPVTWPKKYERCEGILGAKMYAVRKCNSAEH